MRVLITGATGFLGGYLVEECLRRHDRVRVLVRRPGDGDRWRAHPEVDVAYGDLTDARSLHAACDGVDAVIHSAGRVREFGSRAQFWSANVDGTRLLLDAARAGRAGRFTYVSSPSAVMTGGDQRNIDERTPYPGRFVNRYAESKTVAEQAVLEANSRELVTCSVRPRGIWGPRDRHGILPQVLRRLAHGSLPDLSAQTPVHASLCYCVNAAHACRLTLDSAEVGGRAYFVADAETVDVWHFIRQIAEMFGLTPPTRRVSPVLMQTMAGLVDQVWRLPVLAAHWAPPLSRYGLSLLTRTTTYDTSAASRDFGFRPPVDQSTGLRLVKEWVDGTGGVAALLRGAGS